MVAPMVSVTAMGVGMEAVMGVEVAGVAATDRRSASADFQAFLHQRDAGSRPGGRDTFLLHDKKVPKEACPASPV